jgi:regulator of sigma D
MRIDIHSNIKLRRAHARVGYLKNSKYLLRNPCQPASLLAYASTGHYAMYLLVLPTLHEQEPLDKTPVNSPATYWW